MPEEAEIFFPSLVPMAPECYACERENDGIGPTLHGWVLPGRAARVPVYCRWYTGMNGIPVFRVPVLPILPILPIDPIAS